MSEDRPEVPGAPPAQKPSKRKSRRRKLPPVVRELGEQGEKVVIDGRGTVRSARSGRAVRPSALELYDAILEGRSAAHIGQHYGVTGAAVRKWIRHIEGLYGRGWTSCPRDTFVAASRHGDVLVTLGPDAVRTDRQTVEGRIELARQALLDVATGEGDGLPPKPSERVTAAKELVQLELAMERREREKRQVFDDETKRERVHNPEALRETIAARLAKALVEHEAQSRPEAEEERPPAPVYPSVRDTRGPMQ